MQEQPWLKRLALVTDAWTPQVNGVARTLVRLVDHLRSQGIEVMVVAPDGQRTVGLISYPEIQVAYDPWTARKRLTAFAPNAVHVATEGPLGFWARGFLGRRRLRFTTSFHTKYPEYITARFGIPASWGYQLVRWFHAGADKTLVSTHSMRRELEAMNVGRNLVLWPRGVDTHNFNPAHRDETLYNLPRPIWLFVGRVAVEKNLDEFLKLDLPGTKVVVGDGPSRATLEAQYPGVVWRGYQNGKDLAAHYASADYFVFPSRTETFGNVLLEALASGLPVAAVPAPGAVDFIREGVNGALADDLRAACERVRRCSPAAARESVMNQTVRAGHDVFVQNLTPVSASALDEVRTRALWETYSGGLLRVRKPQQRLPHAHVNTVSDPLG